MKRENVDREIYKDLSCFVINLLNNKTIILLNLAEYRITRYSAGFLRIIVKYFQIEVKGCHGQVILLYIRLTMKNLIGREHSINSQ